MAFRKIQTTNLTSTDTAFSDPLIILNKENQTVTDIGFLGRIGADTYTGIVRDSQTDTFLLLNSITLSDATVNDVDALDASIVKGNITVGTITADSFIGIDSFTLPKGTAVQRPTSPVEGMMFFNTTTKMFEGYNGTEWLQLVPSRYEETP